MSPSSQSFRVAIVGGGLCGLTCAIPLLKAGVDVQVYEGAVSDHKPYQSCMYPDNWAQHKFAEIGAGVCLGMPDLSGVDPPPLRPLGRPERNQHPDQVGHLQ